MSSPVSPVLEALDHKVRTRLLDRTVVRVLDPGERFYLAGDRERRVHILRRGIVKMIAAGPEGDETILYIATAGEILGDVAALDELPQPLDAVTTTSCELWGLDSDVFLPPELGKWRKENPEEIESIVHLIEPTMTRLGYAL